MPSHPADRLAGGARSGGALCTSAAGRPPALDRRPRV